MANLNCRLGLVAAIVVALIHTGSSLKCYQCSEISQTDCKDTFTRKTNALVCSEGQVCVKHKTPAILNLPAYISRGCFPPDYCELVKSISYCSTCTTDLCNSSSIVVPSFYFVALLYLCINSYLL